MYKFRPRTAILKVEVFVEDKMYRIIGEVMKSQEKPYCGVNSHGATTMFQET